MTTPARFACLVLLLTLPLDQSRADSQYEVRPPPSWVIPGPGTTKESQDPDRDSGGVRWLLVDHQIRLDAVEQHYSRYVSRFTNGSGLEDNSQITIDYDPKIERLNLHSVVIRRNGRPIDQLRSGRIRVIQRETNLKDQLVDGELTFHLVMSDVRVGDVLDYSYTVERRNAEWRNRNFGRLTTQWGAAVDLLRIRLLVPAGAGLKTASSQGIEPKKSTDSGWSVAEWSIENVARVRYEKDAPSWFQQYGSIEYSQFADWGQIVELAVPLYSVAESSSRELKEIIESLKAKATSDGDRAIAAMKFVQEEVRYTGIEEGEGAFRPTPPNEVLARRYGDCKDKALLAVTMLRALGIEAAPALVSTRWRREVANHLPSPGGMDHVVVRAVIAGETHWFDATSTGQGGGLAHFTQAQFGKALVIAPGVRMLEDMPVKTLEQPHQKSLAVFDLRGGLHAETSFEVTTTYFDGRADWMRRQLRSDGIAELGQQYLHYYKDQYPNVASTGALKVTDKIEDNELSVSESYRIKDGFEKGKDGKQKFYVDADAITTALAAPGLPERTTPLALSYPKFLSTRVQLLMPSDWQVDADALKVDTPRFHYASSVAYRNRVITLDSEFRTLSDFVPAAEMAEHVKELQRARDDTYFNITRPSQEDLVRKQKDPFLALKLIGVAAALFLSLRMLRLVLTVHGFLMSTLRHVESRLCDETDVPEGARALLKSLDSLLADIGFAPAGFVQATALYTRFDKAEHFRILLRSDGLVAACVTRHLTPEYGAYVRLWFESTLDDGSHLQTVVGTANAMDQVPGYLVEKVQEGSPPEIYARHQERLSQFEGQGRTAIKADMNSIGASIAQYIAAIRAAWYGKGWIHRTTEPILDYFTLKGAFQIARASIQLRARGPSGASLLALSSVASPQDRSERVAAEIMAASHIAKIPIQPDERNSAMILYCGLGMAAVVVGLVAGCGAFQTAAMLTALVAHELAHRWALGKRLLPVGLLLFSPFVGQMKVSSHQEMSVMRRVGILLAGPMMGLLIGFALLGVNVLTPNSYCRDAAAIFIGFNSLLLIAYPGTDGYRVLAAVTSPGSLARGLPQVLSAIVLLSIGVELENQFLASLGFLLAIWCALQWRSFMLIRKIAHQIPARADFRGAIHAAFVTMTEPPFARWSAAVRQMRAISIAAEATRPAVRRSDQIWALVAYGVAALLATAATVAALR